MATSRKEDWVPFGPEKLDIGSKWAKGGDKKGLKSWQKLKKMKRKKNPMKKTDQEG